MSELKIISKEEYTEYVVEELKDGKWKRFEVFVNAPNYTNIFYTWWVRCTCDEYYNRPVSLLPGECVHTKFILPQHIANYSLKKTTK